MSSVLGRELRSWCCWVRPKPPKTKPEKKSSSAYHLSGRQLCTLARVILFASIIVFRCKDNHITLLCWDPPPHSFFFLVALGWCPAALDCVQHPLLWAFFLISIRSPHDILLSKHINFLSIYGFLWSLISLRLSTSYCLWWNPLPSPSCFMWPIPFPASSLGLDIISSRKPSLTILDQIKWLFNTFLLQLLFITLFVVWLVKSKFSIVLINVIFQTACGVNQVLNTCLLKAY